MWMISISFGPKETLHQDQGPILTLVQYSMNGFSISNHTRNEVPVGSFKIRSVHDESTLSNGYIRSRGVRKYMSGFSDVREKVNPQSNGKKAAITSTRDDTPYRDQYILRSTTNRGGTFKGFLDVHTYHLERSEPAVG